MAQAKKLFVVTLTTEVVVVADDLDSAEDLALAAERDRQLEPAARASEMRYLPGDFDLDSIPFGDCDDSDPDRTIQGWIDAGAGEMFKAASGWVPAPEES
jgi:hypothetical protein